MSSSSLPASLAVLGATGRLGKRIIACLAGSPELKLVGAYASEHSPARGLDVGVFVGVGEVGVRVEPIPDVLDVDVVIDVSQPAGTRAVLGRLSPRTAFVVGVTGLSESDTAALHDAAAARPILLAPNFSAGVHVLADLVARAASALPAYDIEVIESHHRHKVDAPSGTAVLLGKAAAQARGWQLDGVAQHGRNGRVGERPAREIGFHALRMGDVVGEHQVWIAGDGERLCLGHVATSRDAFALGALRAASWLITRPAGSYTMRDVLGLTSPLQDGTASTL